jgi:hypothetical protein
LHSTLIVSLRGLIVFLLLGCLFAQVLVIPGLAALTVDGSAMPGEIVALHLPLVALGILFVACAEVSLVCIWMLLSKVRSGRIFDGSAFRPVNAVIVALTTATLLIAVVIGVLAFVGGPPPIVGLMLVGALLGGVTLTLVVVVMRGLLRQATALERDLAEVV